MAESLYGVKQAKKTQAKELSSSTSLAFSSNLASLISSSTSKSSSSGRVRPSKSKSDIFTSHNKNVKKRAAKDLEQEEREQQHQTRDDIGSVSTSELHRSKRRMEEKVRLYNAMKRGEYVRKDNAFDDRGGLVDFDKKWADSQAQGGSASEQSSNADSDSDNDSGELIEYLDEFGRLRKGSKKQRDRELQQLKIQAIAREEEARFSARPSMPENIIQGDTIQYDAFNPDRAIAERMADLAKKRDKSATPPPDTHFDANAEVRTKGTGFYGFSHDAEGRRKEMDELEKARLETEKIRKEREETKEQRKREIEERRKVIAEQRSKAQADRFLDEFELEPS